MADNTAILFFTRKPINESVNKVLCEKKKTNILIHTNLFSQTIKVLEQTCLPFSISFDTSNDSDSFGSKLYKASKEVFSRGFEHIIIIGNDCPQLNPKKLSEAAKSIKNGKRVIGPDKRGGIYLLAISKNDLDQINFINLPWQTEILTDTLKSNFKTSGKEFELLESLQDINFTFDLKEIIGCISSSNILKLIFQDLYFFQKKFENIDEFLTLPDSSNKGLRAPPAFA